MTRIALVADVHVGNPRPLGGPFTCGLNRRGRQILETMERAVALARVKGCEYIVSLGDLFDASSPSPQLLAAVERILDDSPPWYCIRGNHEMDSEMPGDGALAPLFPVSELIESPVYELLGRVGVALVPFRGGPSSDWFEGDLDTALSFRSVYNLTEGVTTLLAFHLGIQSVTTPAFLRGVHDAIEYERLIALMRERGLSFAACGNWHEMRLFPQPAPGEPLVLQVGTLCPTGFDNPGPNYGRMAIFDPTLGFECYEIPGPRFYQITRPDELEQIVAKSTPDHHLYIEWLARPEGRAEAETTLVEAKRSGKITDYSVRPDRAEEYASARRASVAAASADSLRAAVTRYVDKVELPPGVDRAAVLARVEKYLG